MNQQFMRTLFNIVVFSMATLLLGYAIYLISKNTPRPKTAADRTSPPTSPAFHAFTKSNSSSEYIGGVGILEPIGEATTVGSQIPGVVEVVMVEPGSRVKKGDALIRLDRRSALADLKVAEAEVNAQKAKLLELTGQAEVSRARLEAVSALLEQAIAAERNSERELDRAQALGAYAISVEELDLRRLNLETSRARTLEAKARVHESQASLELLDGKPVAPSVEVQKAILAQAVSNLERAQTQLDLHTIVAPKDATILSVKIRAGEFIPASIVSTPLLTLGNIDTLQVRVDIDESEIPRFQESAPASAMVRGRPEVKVSIRFVRTEPQVIPKRSLTGTVSERVDTRVLQIIYEVDPDAIEATVGQQVDVYIAQQ
ncbi:MAG: biotin/lipoyl-binding protein [Pirellula sp.]|nr:biotin/lipoyl-binding protein [Pirellula sp.]